MHLNSLLIVRAQPHLLYRQQWRKRCVGPYTDNGVAAIILCPSDPTQAVHVEFIVFDLQTNSNVNNQDYLNIYDGNSTADLQWAGPPNSTGTFGKVAPSRHL